MRGIKSITGHIVYNPAYNLMLQAKETTEIKDTETEKSFHYDLMRFGDSGTAVNSLH